MDWYIDAGRGKIDVFLSRELYTSYNDWKYNVFIRMPDFDEVNGVVYLLSLDDIQLASDKTEKNAKKILKKMGLIPIIDRNGEYIEKNRQSHYIGIFCTDKQKLIDSNEYTGPQNIIGVKSKVFALAYEGETICLNNNKHKEVIDLIFHLKFFMPIHKNNFSNYIQSKATYTSRFMARRRAGYLNKINELKYDIVNSVI